MIKELVINKFKAFKNLEKIDLKPITLLYGQNSAGKSSVLQSLLLQKQSLELDSEFNTLIAKGDYINLGNYNEFVNNHDLRNSVNLGLSFDLDNEVSFPLKGDDNIEYGCFYKYDSERRYSDLFKIEITINNEVLLELQLEKENLYKIKLVNENHPLVERIFKTMENNIPNLLIDVKREILKKISNFNLSRELKIFDKLKTENIDDKRLIKGKDLIKSLNNKCDIKIVEELQKLLEDDEKDEIGKLIGKFLALNSYDYNLFFKHIKKKWEENHIEMLDFNIINYQKGFINSLKISSNFPNIIDILNELNKSYKKEIKNIIYLGPLRDYPERHYIFSGNMTSEVGKAGENAPYMLFKDDKLVDEINHWFDIFQIGYNIKLNKINDSEMEDIFSLRLVDVRRGISVSPKDVGFGISQILPILIQSIISKNKNIIIEQPEIHLHPRLQTELGSFLVENLKKDNQFIIETHSEHIILRIQALIRKGLLSKDDVSVIYVDCDEKSSYALKLRLDDEGDFIDEWPGGFFDEGFKEMFL